MKEISGYVFIVDFGGVEELFGKPTRIGNRKEYELLASNGILPYGTLKSAINGGTNFLRRMNSHKNNKKEPKVVSKIINIQPGRLEMKIAETSEESEIMMENNSLVVIKKEIDNTGPFQTLYGPFPEKEIKVGIIEAKFLCADGIQKVQAAPLYLNRFQTFNRVNGISAYGMAQAISRIISQRGYCSAHIAEFKLERI